MNALSSISDRELRERLTAAVSAERMAAADVIYHLLELDRRQLYREDACSSLFAYCVERLGYSEDDPWKSPEGDGATKRMRVARISQRFPQILDELASGSIHLTGLFQLSNYLTEENVDRLLAEARGKSKRQLEELLARLFPRPDVPATLTPSAPEPAQAKLSTMSGAGNSGPPPAPPEPTARARVEPLSATTFRVEFTASATLRHKLQHARNLLSHAVPSGDLGALIERAIDELIAVETKRRSGAGKPRKHRQTKPGSRHVPVDIQRAVRERDEDQCTFVDAEGRRCSERRFLTIEHIEPFALGGPTTVENCCLLCSAHNAYQARLFFGEEHVARKVEEARADRDAAPGEHAESAVPAEPAVPTEPAAPALQAHPHKGRASRRRSEVPDGGHPTGSRLIGSPAR